MIRRYGTPLFVLILLWLACTVPLTGREIPLPKEEAPTALFSADLYDAEVDFFIAGSWTASLQGGAGVTWGDGITGIQPAVLSDFTDGFKFEQIPQLTLSLWYMDRYFFETTITEEQQLETFLFGYFGKENEFLQEARIGNTDIGYGDYGLFSIPAASRHSLGAYGRFEGSYSEHHLAARYDPAQLEEIRFRGSRQLEELRRAPQGFVRGRFFALPDADIDFLRVYLRDDAEGTVSDASGRSYRRLTDDEMVYSLAEGLLFLHNPAASDVVVYYEKGGNAVGDSTLGSDALSGIVDTGSGFVLDLETTIDFYWSADFAYGPYDDYSTFTGISNFTDWQRTINSNDGLLLYSPGQWSPFELLSVYSAGSTVQADSGNTTLWLADKNSSGGSRLPIEQFQEAEKARIAPAGFDLRSHEARYPLLIYTEESSWARSIYGPGPSGGTEPVDKELRFEQLSPAGSYNIGSNVLEGSITVLRNGVPEQRFTFNPDTGEINFFIPPGQNERIDITFRTTSAQAVGGDIFAAAVNRFSFNDQWSADLNLGLRWNADPNAYITEPGEAEGSMLTAGRLAYRSDRFSFSVESGINVRSPNTTGRLRLYGMNDSAFPVSINGELLYPGAPVSSAFYNTPGIGPFNHDSGPSPRGKLFFKDYYNYSFAGGYQLQKYTWDPPDDQVYPYSQSGGDNRTGPYIAATGSETEGNAMVMEYSLASGEWVGGTIPLTEGSGAVDLSHVRAITLLVKHIGRESGAPEGTVNLHLLLGRLYEDLDADGILDGEDSPLDGGFAFNDEGFVLPVAPALPWAPSESRVNSEDLDGNGVLDGFSAILPNPVIKSSSVDFSITENTSWQRITIPLTDEDRTKLKASTGIEFVVAESSGSDSAEGRLLIADIDLQGSPFTGAAENKDDFKVYTRSLDPGSASYKSLMKQSEADLLNEDSVFNTKVTRVDWTSNDWSMTGYHTPVQLDEYESFSFFMRTESTEPDTMRLILRNPQNEGLAVEFSPPTAHSDWRRYTWKLHSSDPDNRILVDGSPVSGGAQLVTPSGGRAAGLRTLDNATGVNEFSVEGEVSVDGAIEIDEVYLHDPRLGIGVGGRTAVEYNYPDALMSIGERPLLHQLNFRQTVYGRQAGYQGGLTPAPAAAVAFTNALDFKLLGSSIALHYNGQWDAAEYLPAGGYRVALPLADGRFQVQDEYSEQHNYDSMDILRSAEIQLTSRQQSTLTFHSTLLWENSVLDRTWDFSTLVRENENLQVSLESAFQSRNSAAEAEADSLGMRYAKFTRWFYPQETAGPHFRRSDHSAGLTLLGGPITAELSHSLYTATSAGQSPFALDAGGGWSARLSTLLGKTPGRGVRVSHSYQRDSSLQQQYGEQNGFLEDLSTLPASLLESPFIWTSPPYYELWSTEMPETFEGHTAGQLSAAYTPSGEISINRNPGSRLYDLFAPARFSFEIERSLQRNFDSISDTHRFNGLYRATALNLFGRLGRYPAFEWYRTEEVSHSLIYSGTLNADEQHHEITVGQFIELNIDQQSVLGIDNTWNQSVGENLFKLRNRLYWQRTRPFEGTVPFEEKLSIKEEKRIQHSDELEFSFQESAGDSVTTAIIAGHTSLLILGESGTLKGFARAGYRRNENRQGDGSVQQHTIAVEIGTELILRF